MTEVYTSASQPTLLMAKSWLESYGIECEVTNDVLFSISGDVPPDQCWPKLHVVDDAQSAFAREKIAEYLAQAKNNPAPSFCPKCDAEDVELVGKKDGLFFPKYRCRKCGEVWKHVGV